MLAPPTKRLFFALWPDPQTRQACQALSKSLRTAGRPVAGHNLHVTLAFLGNVTQSQQQAICLAADQVKALALEVMFDRLSFWKKPAIACLTASQFDARLAILAGQLADMARQNGLDVDSRPYVPHVTLFRKLNVPLQAEFAPIVWPVSAFCLVESCSTGKGVEYRVLQHWSS